MKLVLKEQYSFPGGAIKETVLFGTFMYSVVRSREMDKNKLKSSPKITLLQPTKDRIDLESNDENTEERPLLIKRDQ